MLSVTPFASQIAGAQVMYNVESLRKVADWQVNNLGNKKTDWQHCVFYIGLWEFYEFSQDRSYYEVLYEVGAR